MSWEDTIKMPKHLKRIKRKIDQMPDYEVVEIDASAAHGGKVDFTESEENEKHEDEPHSIYPPSTPKDKTYGNYMRKLPSIMRRAAQGRKRFMNQSGKPLVAKSWFNILKSIKTATRSAELWVMNEEPVYREVLAKIKSLVKSGHDKEKILEQLAIWLPSIMLHMEGFMEELEREDWDGSIDSISDVDWEEVASNYDEDIDTILEDYA